MVRSSTTTTVGGETFKAAVQNIAVDGRVIVFSNTSTYLEDDKAAEPLLSSQVNAILLDRSASLGSNFGNCATRVTANTAKLFQLIAEGKLKSVVEKTEFKGLEAIPDAIEYMFARENVGKLAIKLV